ncbi:DUF485 domain-containing protein [Streptomyces sp. NPDC001393]
MTPSDDNPYPPPPPVLSRWSQQHAEPYAFSYEPHEPYERYEPYGQAARHGLSSPETDRHGGDLAALRSAYRVLRRVSTLTALGSFVVYVVLSCSAPDLMGSKITGELSLGMALGVLQLVVTFGAVLWYGRSAQRSVDPLARAVRERAVRRPAQGAGVAR